MAGGPRSRLLFAKNSKYPKILTPHCIFFYFSEELEEFEVMPDDLLESLNGENENFLVKQENSSKKVKEELDEKHLDAKER